VPIKIELKKSSTPLSSEWSRSASSTITIESILKSIDQAPDRDRKEAERLASDCMRNSKLISSGEVSSCTRLGIWATQANQKSYPEFRKLALSLACEHGTEVFSCAHLYHEASDPQSQRELRIALDGRCLQNDERVCTALGRVVLAGSTEVATEFFKKACELNPRGFACAELGELLLVEQGHRSEIEKKCADGELGMCLALLKNPRSDSRAVDVDRFCEVAKNSVWESQACTRAAALGLESKDKARATDQLISGCRSLREDTNQFCRMLSLKTISSGSPRAREIRDAYEQGCQNLAFTPDECKLP
jgi:hypothetical protein